MKFYQDLDEEIDYLHSVIAKQEVSEIKPPHKQPKHPGKNLDNNQQNYQTLPVLNGFTSNTRTVLLV